MWTGCFTEKEPTSFYITIPRARFFRPSRAINKSCGRQTLRLLQSRMAYSSIVRRQFLFLCLSYSRGADLPQLLHYQPDVGLQPLDHPLLPGNDLIQLLDRIFMVQQLDLNIGYPFFHGCSLDDRISLNPLQSSNSISNSLGARSLSRHDSKKPINRRRRSTGENMAAAITPLPLSRSAL